MYSQFFQTGYISSDKKGAGFTNLPPYTATPSVASTSGDVLAPTHSLHIHQYLPTEASSVKPFGIVEHVPRDSAEHTVHLRKGSSPSKVDPIIKTARGLN